MRLDDVALGILLGVVGTVGTLVWTVVRLLQPRHTPAVAAEAVDSVDGGVGTTAWLSAVVERFFRVCAESVVLRQRLSGRLERLLSARMHAHTTAGLITSLRVRHVDLGHQPPLLTAAQLISSPADRHGCVSVQFAFQHIRPLSIIVDVHFRWGATLPVSISVDELSGNLYARCPYDAHDQCHFGLALSRDTKVKISTHFPAHFFDKEFIHDFLAALISRKAKNAFEDAFFYPNWRSFDLPLVTPTSSEKADMQEQPPDTPSDQQPEQLSVASRQSSGGVQHAPSTPHDLAPSCDVLEGKCFTVEAVVNEENFLELANQLTNGFLATLHSDRLSWQIVKQKKDIVVQKANVGASFVFRAKVMIGCSCSRIFQIIRNPNHLTHFNSSFENCELIQQFDQATTYNHYRYRMGSKRIRAQAAVLQVARIVDDSVFVVVQRSAHLSRSRQSSISTEDSRTVVSPQAAMLVNASAFNLRRLSSKAPASASVTLEEARANISASSKTSSRQLPSDFHEYHKSETVLSSSKNDTSVRITVNIFGYHIERHAENINSSCVTILSQVDGPDFRAIDVTMQQCQKMKAFIEELEQWNTLSETIQSQ